MSGVVQAVDLSAIWMRSTTALFLLNEQSEIVFANPSFAKLAGWATTPVGEKPLPLDPPWNTLLVPAGGSGDLRSAIRPAPDGGDDWSLVWYRCEIAATRYESGTEPGEAVVVLADCWLGMAWRGAVDLRAEAAERPVDPMLLMQRLARWRRATGPRMPEAFLPASAVRQMEIAAGNRYPVVIVGETGTDKEAVARLLHRRRHSADAPFLILDAPSLTPARQREHWERFAHLWTTDTSSQPAFQGGTLYLHRPHDLGRDVQEAIAEFLSRPASNRSTPDLIAGALTWAATGDVDERLTTSLAALLGSQVIYLPPLRHRLADLPGLATALLADETARTRPGRPLVLSLAAVELLTAAPWPGNLSELRRVLRELVRSLDPAVEIVEPDHLPVYLHSDESDQTTPTATEPTPSLDQMLEKVERHLLEQALTQSAGNRSKAAQALGISRPRLLRRLEQLGIDRNRHPS